MARNLEGMFSPYSGRPTFDDNQKLSVSKEFSYEKMSFFGTGQDSFSAPPAQDPEMFEQLTNIQPVVQGTLQRRWGFGTWSNPIFDARPKRLASYQRDADGLRRIISFKPGGAVSAYTEVGGAVTSTPVVGPSAPDGLDARGATSRNFFYIADGSPTDLVKWDGSSSTTQWGIDGPIAPIMRFPDGGTASNDTASAGAGTLNWTNTGSATSYDGFNTSYNSIGASAYLKLVGYSFGSSFNTSNSTLSILGIQVRLSGLTVTPNSDGSTPVVTVKLYKAGVLQATSRSYAINTITNSYGTAINAIAGGINDLWGTTWSPADITNANFGVAVQVTGINDTTGRVALDSASVIINSTQSCDQAVVAGNITLVNGRVYFVVYANATTGHISDLSAATPSTGVLTNNQINLSNIPTSTDPQVDTKYILATADGGDQTTLYLAGTITNAATTFSDNMPEATLLVQSKMVSTDDFGNEFGCALNKKPPAFGTLPTKHRGRMYLASGQILSFSKNISEITTNTGTIAGRWEESWPGSNFLDISEGAETVRGLLSDGSTLFIGTERHVRRLLGDGPDNFQEPEILFNETGVLNQDIWQIAFLEGSPVGAIWITPDFRVIGSDFNTYEDIGSPVQDVLNTINSSVASSVSRAAFVATAAFDLYILGVPTGTELSINTLLVYNLRTRKWAVWNKLGGVNGFISSMLYTITAAGVPLLLFGLFSIDYSIQIVQVSSAFTQDTSINNDSTTTINPISSTVRTSWLDLGDPSVRKVLQEVEVLTGDTAMTVDVQGASLDREFSNPNTVVSGKGLTKVILNPLKLQIASAPSKDRFYRFTFHSTGVQDVLSGYRVTAVPLHRS